MERRTFLKTVLAGLTAFGFSRLPVSGQPHPFEGPLIQKSIPSTGEKVPVIGMGTWQTFDVGADTDLRNHRTQILKEFFKGGGGIIDSSPMYGSSEAVVGYGLEQLAYPSGLFSATKVWTSDTERGKEQIQQSKELWGLSTLDLEQVHNLVNCESHLKTLFELKQAGTLKHVGVTTYGGYRHSELANIMRTQPLDFIQLTYNVENRQAEGKILDLAQERGISVIANRPFGGGPLIDRMQKHPFPGWGPEIGCNNWPQLLLKFIVSHPAITCAIPATTQIVHMQENMGACHGELLKPKSRKRILDYIERL